MQPAEWTFLHYKFMVFVSYGIHRSYLIKSIWAETVRPSSTQPTNKLKSIWKKSWNHSTRKTEFYTNAMDDWIQKANVLTEGKAKRKEYPRVSSNNKTVKHVNEERR